MADEGLGVRPRPGRLRKGCSASGRRGRWRRAREHLPTWESSRAQGAARGQLEDFDCRPRQAEDYSAEEAMHDGGGALGSLGYLFVGACGQTCLLPSRPPRKSAKNMSVPHSSSTWRRKLPCHEEGGRRQLSAGRAARGDGGRGAAERRRERGGGESWCHEEGRRRKARGAGATCLRAGDEADRLGWHHDGGEVVAVVVLDVDRADALSHHALNVLLGARALVLGAADLEGERVLEQVEIGARDARDLLLCSHTGGRERGGNSVHGAGGRELGRGRGSAYWCGHPCQE